MSKQALMTTTDANHIDTSDMPTLTGFAVAETCPFGTSARYVIKAGDGNWQKYDSTKKTWTDIATQKLTGASVIAEGNTAAELSAVPAEAMTVFAGKVVDVAIGLQTNDKGDMLPTIDKFSICGKKTVENHQYIVPCGSIILSEYKPMLISSITADKNTVGSGDVAILAAYQLQDGTYSDYIAAEEYTRNSDISTRALKFRARYTVQNIGTDSVTLNSIEVRYRKGNSTPGSTATCFTKLYKFEKPVANAHLILKHPDTPDTKFEAYICHRAKEDAPEVWIPMEQDNTTKTNDMVTDEFDYTIGEDEEPGGCFALRIDITGSKGSVKDASLGVGTGASTSYKLPHSAIPRSIKVSPSDSESHYDARTKTLEVKAPANTPVTVSYDWESETTYLDSMSCIFSE